MAEKAWNAGTPLFLVGGPVRDMLLGKPIKDLDLVVQGDAQALAARLASELDGEVVARSQFGTATLKCRGQRLDLVTARRETYPRPGALPKVTPSTIQDDLARRDFAMNAMALPLSGPSRGSLLDPHGGRRDLGLGLIRILHSRSFIDDPTRVLRAIRYEQRLGLSLESETHQRLVEAVEGGAMDTVSGDRLRKELGSMLREALPHRPLRRCGDLGILRAIHSALGDGSCIDRAAAGGRENTPLACLAAISFPLSTRDGESFIRRLRMPSTWAGVVRDTIAARLMLEADRAAGAGTGNSALSPSALSAALDRYSPVALRVNMLLSDRPAATDALSAYLARWRYVKPSLSGKDLIALGMPEGPLVGEVLVELRAARIDGKVATREEEVRLAQSYITSRRPALDRA
jgi:tRNA nucleotidyltransferase (CCA-adding enzyme)